MSQARQNPSTRLIQAIAAIVGLVIIVMLVLSYWGNYRSSKDPESSEETTATIEATTTPEGEGEQPAEGDEGDEAESATTVVVLIEGLNFRTAPSRDADLIHGLNKGDRLLYIATEDGWYKVKTQDGKEGYVSSSGQYTELEE